MNCVNTHRPTNRTLAVIEGRIEKPTDNQPLATAQKPKLLEQVRQAIRTRHYSYMTESVPRMDQEVYLFP
jgi:hypothetical protein